MRVHRYGTGVHFPFACITTWEILSMRLQWIGNWFSLGSKSLGTTRPSKAHRRRRQRISGGLCLEALETRWAPDATATSYTFANLNFVPSGSEGNVVVSVADV